MILRKAVFIVQLELDVENGTATVENIHPNIIENIAGEWFQSTSYWEILIPYKNAVEQDNLIDTDIFKLYDQIAYRSAREENQNIESTKQNYKEKFNWTPFIQKVKNSNPLEEIF